MCKNIHVKREQHVTSYLWGYYYEGSKIQYLSISAEVCNRSRDGRNRGGIYTLHSKGGLESIIVLSQVELYL